MQRPVLIALLLLIPLAHAYILVYSNGFDYRQNYGKDVYVRVESVDQIIRTWQDWGYKDIRAGTRIDPNADGIVVLGCTKMDDSDVRALENYVKNGGRVAIDLYCPGRLDDFLYQYGAVRQERPYTGTIIQTLKLPYVEAKGYPVDRPIVVRNSPVNSKYVRMVYVGPTFLLTGDTFSDAFLTPSGGSVAFMGKIGAGEIFASGCLLCSNQLLTANILDWLEDGKVDFPKISVDRRVYPPVKKVGEEFFDEVRVTVPAEERDSIDISVAYPYNEPGYCQLTPVQEREVQDNTAVFKFVYRADRKESCTLAPVVVSLTWISPRGKILREFSVPGEYVQVVAPALTVPPNYIPHIAASILIILAAIGYAVRKHMKKRAVEKLKVQLKAIQESIDDLQKKYMTRQITDDVYKRLLERYIAEMEDLKARIKIMEEESKK